MNPKATELGRAMWQFELSGAEVEPRLKAHGKVGDSEGEFWLKRWGDRLLFCSALFPSRVFAATSPCEAQRDLTKFWRAALRSGEFGRMILSAQPLAKTEETDTGFLMIYGAKGARWTREWCSGPWIETHDARLGVLPAWHPDWKVPLPCAVNQDTLARLRARPFDEATRADQPFVWLRGSRVEWKRVLQACATMFFGPNTKDHAGREVREGWHRSYFFAHTPFFASWMHATSPYVSWGVPELLRPVLNRHFVGAGWKWSRRHNKDEFLREGWKVTPRTQSAEIYLALHPSAHERLEAHFFLRDWLRDKLPASQIEEILSHVQP